NNTPAPTESTSYTSEPLGLEMEFDFVSDKSVFIMGGISRVQQANTSKAENSIYRINVEGATVAATNTGTDHRDFLRRSIIMTGIIASPGKKEIALQV